MLTSISDKITIAGEIQENTMLGCSLQVKRAMIKDDIFQTTEDTQARIEELIDNGDRLIKYKLKVHEDNGPFSDERADEAMLLKPYNLMLTLDDTGKALLNLKEYFEPMSLYTLGYGVEGAEVELIQKPSNCLLNVTALDLETYLKRLIFRNFENTTTTSQSGKEVCSKIIRKTENDIGETTFQCCRLEFGDKLVCQDLEGNIYIQVLLTIIFILQLLFVLYSPTFVPKKDRLSTKFLDYIYKPENPLKLKIVVTDSDKVIADERFVIAKKFPFIELCNLKEHLRNVTPGVLYTVTVSQAYLCVRASKIFPGGYSPVGLVKFLKNFFIRCNMRNSIPALKSCCKADMFKKSQCCRFQWFKCLASLMGLLAAALITLPWIFRILFYYDLEEDLVESEIRVLDHNNLERPFPGSLVLYLTPTHPLFIAIYVILLFDIIILIFLPPVARRKLKFTIRMSLRNMNSASKFDAFVSFLAHMLFPLEEYGALGLVFLIPFWLFAIPFGLLILCYLIFPIINLTVRLLANLIYYTLKFCKPGFYRTFDPSNEIFGRIWDVIKEWMDGVIVLNKYERRSRRNMMIHVISLALCVLTIAMLLVLVVECISFYIECAVYIVIGIVLNSKRIMKFLSLFVLISWYGFDCFGAVGTRYQNFAKVINAEILGKVGDTVKQAAVKTKAEQKEQAFTVPSKDGAIEERMEVFTGTEGFLKWNAKRLLLFLDKSDIPYIPKDFLFKAARMGHFFCPGPVHLLYLNALVELLWITLFLGFVMLIILAFGEANNISGANQTLATLAGGFIPFAFRKCFAKSHAGSNVDKSNIRWQTTLAEAIEKYSKRWTFSDFEISSCVPVDNKEIPKQEPSESGTEDQPKLIRFDQDVPEIVDIIIKQREGINGKMEFWVRKAKKDKPKPNYIWRPRKQASDANGKPIEEHKLHKFRAARNYIWRSRQVVENGDVEVGVIKTPIIHMPNNFVAK